MKKAIKVTLIVLVSLLALIGAGYGAWFAWDTGLLGDNPRALTIEAMDKAVRKQVIVNIRTRGMAESCINVNLNQPPPEVVGISGIAPRVIPGQHEVTLLLQTNLISQPARDIQITQLNYLASQGPFTATDATVETETGPRPARRYRLTWAGYTNSQQIHGTSICLFYGHHEYAGIDKFERLPEKIMGFDVYEVTYHTKVNDVPVWATTQEAKQFFPKLAELTAGRSGKVRVIRADDAWRSAYEIEVEAANASKGGSDNRYPKRVVTPINTVAPTLDEVKALVATHVTDPNWVARNSVACLPIQLQRGGDDKEVQRDHNAPFTVTYYDRGDRKEYEYRAMSGALHVLSALQTAGLAEMDILRPLPAPTTTKAKQRIFQSTQKPQPPVGIRYRISKEIASSLGLTGYGGCLPIGRLKVEVLAVRTVLNMANVYARATIEQTPEWAIKLANELPAVKALIETGLPMVGQLIPAQENAAGKWRLTGLSPMYPSINYSAIPSHLVPLLPKTTASHPSRPIKVPALSRADISSQGRGEVSGPAVPAEPVPAEPVSIDVTSYGNGALRPRSSYPTAADLISRKRKR